MFIYYYIILGKRGVTELMVNHLLFPVEEAVGQASDNSGAFVTYTALKHRYEHLLNRCNQLGGKIYQRRRSRS